MCQRPAPSSFEKNQPSRQSWLPELHPSPGRGLAECRPWLTDMSCCACFPPLASRLISVVGCGGGWTRRLDNSMLNYSFLCYVQLWPGTISFGIFGQTNIQPSYHSKGVTADTAWARALRWTSMWQKEREVEQCDTTKGGGSEDWPWRGTAWCQ